MKFTLTPIAWDELDAIVEYISKDSVKHAELVEDAILDTCEFASRYPQLGHRKSQVKNPKIFFAQILGYPNYSIAYRVDSNPLQVLRIIHAKRDLRKLFPKGTA